MVCGFADRNPFVLSLSKHVTTSFAMRKTLALRQNLCGSALRRAQGERFYLLLTCELSEHPKLRDKWCASWRSTDGNPFVLILSNVEESKHVATSFVISRTLRLRQYVCGSALRRAQGERFYYW